MPVPNPNLYPDFNIVRLSHLEIGVSNLTESKYFYTEILGLQITHETTEEVFLRAMEERGHHCLILKTSKNTDINFLAFKVFSELDLEKAKAWFEDKGLPTEWVDRPFQGKTLRTQDIHGIPLEFYFKMERLPSIHQKYKLYKGVKPLRIDHFNCFSSNVDESVSFWNEMGFRVTEYTEDDSSKNVWAAWLHRKGGVHDMAFTNGLGPRLHHTAFWVPTPLNIIDLCDIMASSGYVKNLERGPGRHGISNAFFLYILDPDGHRIEIYCSDYQTVDPDHEPIKWDLKDPQRQTLWGAPAPRSWFEKGSNFMNLKPKKSLLQASPIVAQ
ncbi:MAG: 3,4-dihydroxyphenylacetate 2,3-dioxygenase [Paracoccaceae bacterium]